MWRFAWIVSLAALAAAPSAAETAIPDFRGIWKGESESIILDGGNSHHPATQSNEPQLRSVSFTLTIDRQDGRRFSGTFSSARSSEKVIAVISRTGAILLADDARTEPHGTLPSPCVTRHTDRILPGADQAAVVG
jgi:hypothetical protein